MLRCEVSTGLGCSVSGMHVLSFSPPGGGKSLAFVCCCASKTGLGPNVVPMCCILCSIN